MKTTELHTTEFLSLSGLETHTDTVPAATYPPAGLITLSCSLGLLNRTPVATLMNGLQKTITQRWRVNLPAGGLSLILWGLCVAGSTAYADNSLSDREVIPNQNPSVTTDLLQFTAGGHVLGFKSNQMYLATGSHALSTEFVGTAGVSPQTAEVTKTSSKTLPLTKVTYPGLWKGITLVYEQTPGGVVKSTYTVAPFAQVNNIKLRYNVPVKVMANGGLRFDFETGYLNESPPIAWQDIGEKKVPVSVAFQQTDKNEAGFAVGPYDSAYPLIIDPALVWNTFVGGTGDDRGNHIAADGSGNVYVTGYAPVSWGTPVHAIASSNDAYVTKLNSAGSPVWHTFIGGTGSDEGVGITVDGSGNIYVTGTSGNSAGWAGGTQIGTYSSATNDCFVVKLDSNGNQLWYTFLGGVGSEGTHGMALDGSGNTYVTGASNASWNTGILGTPVNNYSGSDDAFVAKLNSAGALTWYTFMGAGGNDVGRAVAVDGSSNVYVAGDSAATWGTPVVNYAGGSLDAFAAKLSSTGVRVWNTFMGGTSNDWSKGIALDGSGNVYVGGFSQAGWGTTPVNSYVSGDEGFVTKLDPATGARVWNTFLGGTGGDTVRAIAVNVSGVIYVAGDSSATWGTPLRAYTASSDVMVARLDSAGNRLWHSFLGGTGYEEGSGIAVDGSNNIYVTASGNASWGTPVNAFIGGATLFDAYTVKISDNPPVASNGSFATHENTALSNTLIASDLDADPLTYSIVVNGTIGTATITNASTGGFTYVPNINQNGTDTFTFKVNDGLVDSNIATITITITPTPPPPLPPPLPDYLGLFLQLDGTGSGKVTTDTGLSCQTSDCQTNLDGSLTCNPQQCSQAVKTSTTVTLTPQADLGSYFSSWGGNQDCLTNPMLMNGGKLCIAYFHLVDEALTIVIQGQGTVTATPLTCPGTCTTNYPYNTTVTLQTQPAAGWQFQTWSGDCSSTGQVLMTSTKNCGATFLLNVDADLDHIPSAIEDAAPNHGDGNGDGIPDSQQNNVASFVDAVNGVYLTLQVDKTCPITNVYGELPDQYPGVDRNHHFPQGLTYFELSCAKTQVTVYYHGISKVYNNLRFYKFGPTVPGDMKTIGWYKYPATFAVVMIGGQPVMTTTYTLTDGQLGDTTGVDGKIVDPGGVELK
jgi:hypothetical protein